ncbi:hypothetical protein [Phenylobacterium soli]|uniref:Response regulatory domain-containing protein n=1 Tax=Phenylobacterium soli TaxID=2170551 RepID=A0A328AP04_9CAUL|nr:hypothetical protein [Phenylobacterium soli]RAK56095.1 hypothetical protein DJ017_17050 [Phenylobacterium soli]
MRRLNGERQAGERVLLLSDDDRRGELLRRLLFAAGLRVLPDAARASPALRSAPVTLVALDATAGAARARGLIGGLGRASGRPILVFAARGERAMVRTLLPAGPAAILEMPASPDQVRAGLRRLTQPALLL